MRAHAGVFFLCSAVFSLRTVFAGEIVPEVAMFPVVPGGNLPTAVASPIGPSPIVLNSTPRGWQYKMPAEESLFGTVEMKLTVLPSGYVSDPLQLRIPFDSASDFKVPVVATRVEFGPQAVEQLRRDSVGMDGMEISALFPLYQRARVIFLNRLQDLKQQARQVHAYDLIAAYIMLQCARDLFRSKYNLWLDGSVTTVKDWLHGQAAQNPSFVARQLGQGARGVSNAQIVVNEINASMAIFLRGLFDRIVAARKEKRISDERYCTLFKAYQAFADTLGPTDLQFIERDFIGVRSNIRSAVATCIADEANAEAQRAVVRQAELEEQQRRVQEQIRVMERERAAEAVHRREELKRLDSAIKLRLFP